MDQLPRLNARLATLSDLRDIVRAMRVMAAGSTRAGEAALPAVRRYGDTIDAAVADGLALVGRLGQSQPAERGVRLLVIIGTEHGFVGNLNARLLQETLKSAAGRKVVVVGRRAASLGADMGHSVAGVIPMTTHVQTIPLLARRITGEIADAEEVRVAYCRRQGDGGLAVVEDQIVPVRRAAKPPSPNPPLHHLEPMALLRAFAQEYLMAEIARALTEAFVGENATRLRVLSAADRNIGDKMEELQQQARQLRQETITAELLDIVIGAEAVAKGRATHGATLKP